MQPFRFYIHPQGADLRVALPADLLPDDPRPVVKADVPTIYGTAWRAA